MTIEEIKKTLIAQEVRTPQVTDSYSSRSTMQSRTNMLRSISQPVYGYEHVPLTSSNVPHTGKDHKGSF